MEAAPAKVRVSNRSRHQPDTEALMDYCWRPSCRKQFLRTSGPGRRKEYCTDYCRRAAEKELRQARSRLAHFEALVQKLRIDVAAYGRPDGDEVSDEELPLSLDAHQTAEDAVRRAAGALVFADPADPAVRELKMLYDAIAPVILSERMTA
jgi:hypothetical protein